MSKNIIIGAPYEITRTAIRTATTSGRLAVRLGETIAKPKQADCVPPEVVAKQAVIRHFEDGFGVVNLIEKGWSERKLKARISATAHAMFDEGLVDERTAVELRPLLPASTLRDPELNARRETVVELLRHKLAHDYDVSTITFSHPIMPSEHEDSPIDNAITWGFIASELDGLSHQMDKTPQSRLAMLAITGSPYIGRFFGDQIAGHSPAQDRQHAGAVPQENMLVGVRSIEEELRPD